MNKQSGLFISYTSLRILYSMSDSDDAFDVRVWIVVNEFKI